MLPEIDTPERIALEQEAHDVAIRFLREEFGNIPNALYRTYMHFRDKFEVTVSRHQMQDIMTDARQLEALVADDWADAIRGRFQDAHNAFRS